MDVLFPREQIVRYHEHQFKILFEELYRDWFEDYKRRHEFVPENVRFEHNPSWRNEFFSITCIREGNHWFWRATKVLWVSAGGVI